jgi:hypothetical protein
MDELHLICVFKYVSSRAVPIRVGTTILYVRAQDGENAFHAAAKKEAGAEALKITMCDLCLAIDNIV